MLRILPYQFNRGSHKENSLVTADGKYQWNIVPFGLATAISTFQYVMSKVLTGLDNFTFMYLDDVLIISQSYKDHLQHLHTVFQKFKEAGLKIKLSKCQFFKMHLHYLGHRISANGLEPLPEKLEAIKNLAPAKTWIKHVKYWDCYATTGHLFQLLLI